MRAAERASIDPLTRRFDLFLRDGLSGAARAFGLRMLGIAAGFLANLLLAHALGAHGMGIVALAVTVAGVPAALAVLGLNNALLRFAGAAVARQDWRTILGLARVSLRLSVVASVLGGATVFVAAPLLARDLFDEPALTLPLRLAALSVLPLAVNSVLAGLMKAIGRPAVATLAEMAGLSLAWLIGLSLLALMLGPTLGPVSAIGAYSGGSLLVLALVFLIWRRSTPRVPAEVSEAETRQLLRSSIPLFWIASVHLVASWADTLVLGAFLDAEAVGIYNVALRLASLVSLTLIAVNTVLPQRFAALFADGRTDELQRLARQVTAFLWIVSLPVVLLFVLWPSGPLRLFGPEFVDGRFALVVLTLGHFVNVATGPVGYLLMMSGQERLLRNVVVVATIINIALDLLLIPGFGVNGAAAASAASLALLNISSLALVYRKLGLSPMPWSALRRHGTPTIAR